MTLGDPRPALPSLGLSPLSPVTSRADLVAEAIRTAVLSGKIRPGDTLVERRLAAELGVSKTPVREALIMLASSGLVVLTPTRGTTVRVLDADDLRKIQEVRLLLEPWAVAATTRLGSPDSVTRARAALARSAAHLDTVDHGELSMANRDFHRALYAGCGNEFVVASLDEVRDLAALAAVSLLWPHWPTWRAEHVEHEGILKAVAAGDAESAQRLTRQHIELSGHRAADAMTG
ncbi:GntR family transcriptional regulator [Kutzneria buriramensis]|uniref:DNA-binding GntR family transcriptional regulator n=1 Tax=Kutzneria buriramensis TaxID=1045776 RepID=A0A3E0GU58_9PSEU|nr:GntR family transcriptional regulator [Kutzneria buriramensis]REH28424.1 DNA-binding GntR family transcriptional regulator [Kutzneria buriramensis]